MLERQAPHMGTGIFSCFKSVWSARPGEVKLISMPVSLQNPAADVRISPISSRVIWEETDAAEEAVSYTHLL